MHVHLARAAALAFFMLPFVWSGQAAAIAVTGKPVVEVGFVLDTTGSMGPLIEDAKRKIWSIATAIVDANPDAEIRMGLVAYRDIGDEYVTKKFELTTDIQDLYAHLLELRARLGRQRHGRLHVAQRRENGRRSHYRRRRLGGGPQGRTAEAVGGEGRCPAELLRGMNAAERAVFIDKQMAKRKALNERMATLVKQRDGYMQEQAAKVPAPDSFDRAVADTLSVQVWHH